MTSSPKNCRTGACRCEPINDREAWYCQVHHSEVRLDEIARHLNVKPDTLSKYVDPYDDQNWLPQKHQEAILKLTPDNLAVIRYYARLQHAVAFPIARGAEHAQIAKATKEFGDLLTAHSEAIADGRVSADEAARIAREGREHMEAVAAIVEDMDRRAGER